MSVSTVELEVILYITWRTVPPRFIAIKAIPIPHPPYKTTNKTQNNVNFFLYPYYIRLDLTWLYDQNGRNCLPFASKWLLSGVFFWGGGVRFYHLFSFPCCFLFVFICLRPVYCVPNVAIFFWMIHSWFHVLFSLTFILEYTAWVCTLSFACSIWAIDSHWLGTVLLYAASDWYSFSGTNFMCYLLSFGKLVVNQFTFSWQTILKAAIER